jgi:hypothetical protein
MGNKDKSTDPSTENNGKQPAEGFEEKVDRLSALADSAAEDTDNGTNGNASENPHEAILVTETAADTTAPAAVRIIKKRSLAGALGFLFGATALAGLVYFYYQQNGWQWPPQTASGRVKQADLTALENRLRQSLLAETERRIAARLQQMPALASEQLEPLQSELAKVKSQLADLQNNLVQNPAAATGTAPAIREDLSQTLAPLQQQLQQSRAEIENLRSAWQAEQQRTAEQLAALQQQLSALQEKAATAPLAAGLPQHDMAAMARQLQLQQAANALNSAQLALTIQHRPQAAAVALQQAAEALQQAKASELASAVQSALAQLRDSQPSQAEDSQRLSEAMQAISHWHWQPPAQRTEGSDKAAKSGWLSNLIVIKKIDQPQQAAMTLAEESALKQEALDALSAAALAQQQGDQNRWQQQLGFAIKRLQPLAASQPPLAAAVEQLQALHQRDITPHWPDLQPLQQGVQALLNSEPPNAAATEATNENSPL